MVDRLSPIDQRLEVTATSKTKQPQTENADAFASGRAIGDNGSTNRPTINADSKAISSSMRSRQ